MKIDLRKLNSLDVQMGVKMNVREITKNYATGPEIWLSQNLFQRCSAAQRLCL